MCVHVRVQVLVRRSHGLLHDEMLTAVYNMAAVDFQSFYSEFLRHFLQSLHVTDSQQTAALLAHFHAAEQASHTRLALCVCVCTRVCIRSVDSIDSGKQSVAVVDLM